MSPRELSALIWLAYFSIAEILSLWTSKFPPCIIVSEYQSAKNQVGHETCAPLHEGVMRFLNYLWSGKNHDSIIATGTVFIAIFTCTLWWSTHKLWKAGERQLKITESSVDATTKSANAAEKAADAADLNARAAIGLKLPLIAVAEIGLFAPRSTVWTKR